MPEAHGWAGQQRCCPGTAGGDAPTSSSPCPPSLHHGGEASGRWPGPPLAVPGMGFLKAPGRAPLVPPGHQPLQGTPVTHRSPQPRSHECWTAGDASRQQTSMERLRWL